MIVTKEQALKLWCPMVRFNMQGAAVNITDGARYDATRCQASDCMMWVELPIRAPHGLHRGTCGLISQSQREATT